MFEFDRDRHEYRLDGVAIPSITNLLRPIYEAELSHIPDQDAVEAARERGTKAHAEVERFNRGECDEFESGYTLAWSRFCAATGFKATHVEYSTYHPTLKFGCTIDALGTLADGRLFLPDVKTGSKYKWTPLQTAGQAMALSAHGICERNVLRANIYLFEKGGEWTYRIDEHDDPGDFQALFAFINWQRAKDRYS